MLERTYNFNLFNLMLTRNMFFLFVLPGIKITESLLFVQIPKIIITRMFFWPTIFLLYVLCFEYEWAIDSCMVKCQDQILVWPHTGRPIIQPYYWLECKRHVNKCSIRAIIRNYSSHWIYLFQSRNKQANIKTFWNETLT